MAWHGHLALRYRRDGNRTVGHDRHDGPLRVLRSLGCTVMQGFLFSRPVSGEEATRLLTSEAVRIGDDAPRASMAHAH